MQDQKFGFPLTLHDPATNQPAHVRFFGIVDVQGAADERQVQAALRDGVSRVLMAKLRDYQVAMPTLASSLPHFVPEIIAAALPSLGGASITRLEVHAQVPESATQPAAAAIAAAPSPMESAKENFTSNLEDRVADSVPNRLNVRMAGFKVGVDSDGKVDGDGLVAQAKSKIMDNLIGFAIVGFVVLLLGCIFCGVSLKIALMLM